MSELVDSIFANEPVDERNKYMTYERIKSKLRKRNLSYTEYESAAREAAERLKI